MSAPADARWTRPAEFLVYLVPVGGIPSDLFSSYARLLRSHSVLSLRSLTRPGGYAAELSPFRSLDWSGPGALRFRFVSTNERVEICDGEDVQACRRVVGVLGVCHSPSLPLSGGLSAAHAQFEASVRRFPGLLMHKCFAFEHSFDDATAAECEGLDDLVMFPVHHELQGTGESTVSLHLQVVMDTLAVNLLMALESVIRSATSSATATLVTPKAASGDLASTLLEVNVEPQQTQSMQNPSSSPPVLSRDIKNDLFSSSPSSPNSRSSLSSGSSLSSIPSPLAAGVGAMSALDPRNRRRKRQLARREKLLGDYCVLVSCVSDALNHYTVALDMLREEERRSGGAPGDALWLAAALEGYVFCLYAESKGKFSAELVEKASEAVSFYVKAGTTELESLLIESLGWYYASVAITTLTRSSIPGEAKMLESIWAKQLLMDTLERGLMLFPELQTQRQVEFLIQTSRMLEIVGYRRRVGFFLHDAASLLIVRNAPTTDSQWQLQLSPTNSVEGPQRQRDLKAALMLERVAAERLGIRPSHERDSGINDLPWEVTTLYRKNKLLRGTGKDTATSAPDNAWLNIRFHVLRQLLTISRMLGDTLLVGIYCLQLLETLVWCDSIAVASTADLPPLSPRKLTAAPSIDGLQQPASSLRIVHTPVERTGMGLHAKGGAYSSPPAGIDTKVKRNFINSPSATMSNAAASLSSTLTSTPRILATPRQQFSAAVNAFSTKASPAFTPFSHPQQIYNGEDRTQGSRIAEGKDIGITSGMNGSGNTDGPKGNRSAGVNDSDGGVNFRHDVQSGPSTVWNLRSKTEIAKIQRKLFSLLESDCTALRSSEQVQLPTFLRVDKLKLRSSCNLEHPFLSRSTALSMFGVQSASSHQTVKSDFFYSPFEKQKRMRTVGQKGDGMEEEDDDDEAPAMYERKFPVHERIELQLTLSNPMGVAVTVQQVKAWVVFVEDNYDVNGGNTSTGTTSGDGVECYPCFFTLKAYEKRKTVMLGIQPLRVGTFHVRGCFIKTCSITTSSILKNPVVIRVVNELPLVSFSLRESGTLERPGQENDISSHQLPTGKMRIAMFSSEVKRCTLRVRSTGNRQITNYRLAAAIQQGRSGRETCVIFNNLPPISAVTTDSSFQAPTADSSIVTEDSCASIETQCMALHCGKFGSPPLPLENGDFVSIPFEVSLRGDSIQDSSPEKVIQLEWSFVYADDACSKAGDSDNTADAVFYRESKLLLEIVVLPSLVLRSISLLPCSVEPILAGHHDREGSADRNLWSSDVAQQATTDHLFCVIQVHVVNPTETAFLFQLRRGRLLDRDGGGAIACQAEIGRQCSRRFALEAPRLLAVNTDDGTVNLIEVLNDLMELHWETYFGTRGQLCCKEYHIDSRVKQEKMRLELVLPPIFFQVLSTLTTPAAHEALNGYKSGDEHTHEKGNDASHYSAAFFQEAHMRVGYRAVQTRPFEYVPIAIAIHRRSKREQEVSNVEVEVVITEDDDGNRTSNNVMVVGVLKAQIQWDHPTDKTVKRHEIQCMFLSEGNFRVAVCGRVLAQDMHPVGSEVWSHQPIYVHVRADSTAILDKSII